MNAPKIQLVTTPEELTQVCCHFLKKAQDSPHNFVALDTEFIRMNTYFPKLALIQIGTGDLTVLVDYTALKGKSLQPLLEIFSDSNIVKVFHAARQDCEVLLHTLHQLPDPIFDTQVASALLGRGMSISYEDLVQETLGLSIDKGCQLSPWLHRPLTTEQVQYAANDVIYLAQIYPILVEQLKQCGRLAWENSESAAFLNKDLYEVDASAYWKKFPFIRSQWKAALLMKYLTAWREAKAITLDKPRAHLISDQALFEISLRKDIFEIDPLALIQGVRRPNLKHFSWELWTTHHLLESFGCVLQQVQTSIQSDLLRTTLQKELTCEMRRDQLIRIHNLKKAFKKIFHQCSKKYNIAETLFASRKDLDLFVQGIEKTHHPFLTFSKLSKGWRKELLKEFIPEIEALINRSQTSSSSLVKD